MQKERFRQRVALNRTERLVRNVFLSLANFLLSALVGLITSIAIARTLSPTGLGFYTYLMWVAGVFALASTLGLPMATSKYVSEYQGKSDDGVVRNLACRLLAIQFVVIVVGLAAFGVLCATRLHWAANLNLALAGIIFFSVAQQSLTAVLAGLQAYGSIARAGVWAAGIRLAAVMLALLQPTPFTLVMANLLGVCVGTLLCLRAAMKGIAVEWGWRWRPLGRELAGRVRSFWLTASYALILYLLLWQRSETFFLSRYSSFAELAFFTLPFLLSETIRNVAANALNAMMPAASAERARAGVPALRPMVRAAIKYSCLLLIPVSVFGIVLAPDIVHLIYGPNYAPVVPLLRLRLLVLPMIVLDGVATAIVVYGCEKLKILALISTPVAILNVVLDILLIPRFGALGATIVSCATQILDSSLALVYGLRLIDQRAPGKPVFRGLGLCIVAAIPVLVILRISSRPAGHMIAGGLGVLAYFGFLRHFGQLETEEIDVVIRAASPGLTTERDPGNDPVQVKKGRGGAMSGENS